MFKSLVFALALLIASPAVAEPFVSPQVCEAIASDIFSIATTRDNKVPAEKVLADLHTVSGGDVDSIPYKFYSFWIKVIYSSSKPPQDLAMEFYLSCMNERGDIGKLYGVEA